MSNHELRPRGRRSAAVAAVDPAPASVLSVELESVVTRPTVDELPMRPRDAARRAREISAVPVASVTEVPNEDSWASVLSAPVQEKNYSSRAAASRGRRRVAAATPKKSVLRSAKAAQRGGMVLAAAGLALAVVVPSAANSLTANAPQAGAAPSAFGPVSADANAVVTFSNSTTTSVADPDGKLHQALSASASKVTATASKGTLSSPLDSLLMTSPFGYRVNPVTGAAGELHTGQDYAASCGSKVYAAAGGTVTFAGWHQLGGGNRIVIDHGNGLSTAYLHNTTLQVKVGQKVSRGDLIALSGTTGNSTGCHVHFEVMVDDKTVDPLGWL